MRVLDTERLTVRHLRPDDAEPLAAVFGDRCVMRFGEVRTRAWIEAMIADSITLRYGTWGFGRWAVDDRATGMLVGVAGLSRYPGRVAPGEVELGYRLVRSAWGRGLATEVAAAILAHGLGALALERIVALIDPANTASVAVARKIGMRREGEVMLEGYDHPDHRYVRERAGVAPDGGCLAKA